MEGKPLQKLAITKVPKFISEKRFLKPSSKLFLTAW